MGTTMGLVHSQLENVGLEIDFEALTITAVGVGKFSGDDRGTLRCSPENLLERYFLLLENDWELM